MSEDTSGSVDAVPCPKCGKTQDLTDLSIEGLLRPGYRVKCGDCGRVFEICAMDYEITVYARDLY